MRNSRNLAILTACALLIAGCGINKSIRIADGETVDGGKATVNGNVFIGADCTVRGDCRTVNDRSASPKTSRSRAMSKPSTGRYSVKPVV
jgi:hypothetical protein